MLKRSKIAVMLIAIQSLAFLPAVQVQAKVTDDSQIKIQSGQINDAVAYKNGTFCIFGNIDGLGNGAYVLKDGEYKKINSIGWDNELDYYGEKYAEVHKGQYFIDLSNGSALSNNLEKSDNDKASLKLRDILQSENQGRYTKEEFNNPKTLKALPKIKSAEGWYESSYSLTNTSTIINGGCKESTVYSDSNGNYIDADYKLGEITIGLDNGKKVKVSDTYNKVEDLVCSISNMEVIGQDSKNIYRLADITIKLDAVDGAISSIDGIKIDNSTTGLLLGDKGKTLTFEVIQSLSKDSDSQRVSGIRCPKTVTNYFIGNSTGSKINIIKYAADGFTICNGKLINYNTVSSFIEAQEIELKKGSNNFNYIELKNKSSIIINNQNGAYDLGEDGSLYVLSNGNISKFNVGKGFENLYALDEKYSNISAYNEDNIAVWDRNNNKYIVIGSKTAGTINKAVKQDADTQENTSANNDYDIQEKSNIKDNLNIDNRESNQNKAEENNSEKDNSGWQSKDGKWYFYKNNNLCTGWNEVDGKWYYFESDGSMCIGWKNINSIWYYFDESGAMAIGWKAIGSDWYYFNKKGEMLSNTVVDGYLVAFDGRVIY